MAALLPLNAGGISLPSPHGEPAKATSKSIPQNAPTATPRTGPTTPPPAPPPGRTPSPTTPAANSRPALGAAPYAYTYGNIGNRKTAQEQTTETAYDNIGNRETAQEAAQSVTSYAANRLNQYTAIGQNAAEPFLPEYDADGNQTTLQTQTGKWTVDYNANNRPIRFTSQDGATVIENGYDYMGRRYMKKVTVNGTVVLHQHYLYRGYLQIAALDLTRSNAPALWLLHWDPIQPVATRPPLPPQKRHMVHLRTRPHEKRHRTLQGGRNHCDGLRLHPIRHCHRQRHRPAHPVVQ